MVNHLHLAQEGHTTKTMAQLVKPRVSLAQLVIIARALASLTTKSTSAKLAIIVQQLHNIKLNSLVPPVLTTARSTKQA